MKVIKMKKKSKVKKNNLILAVSVALFTIFLVGGIYGWVSMGGTSDLLTGSATAISPLPFFSLSMNSDPTTAQKEILRSTDVRATSRYEGKQKNAWQFDGKDSYVVTSSTELRDLDEFTIVFWLKPTDLGLSRRGHILWQGSLDLEGKGRLAGDGWGTEQELHLSLGDELGPRQYGKDQLTFYFGDENNNLKIAIPMKYVDWQHVAVAVRNSETGANAKLYFEGVLIGEDSTAQPISREKWQETTLRLGEAGKEGPAGDANRYYKGMLDELAIYDEVLTSDEISRLCWKQNKGVSCGS